MRSPREESVTFSAPADAVFQAALGVAQANKNATVLAVHNDGRKLMFRDRPKMSNAKFQRVWVEDLGDTRTLQVVVGTDPRTPKALLDGKANEKALRKYCEAVQGAVDGRAPAPATPVANHFIQKGNEVAWLDPDQEPDIELDGNIRAIYGL